MTIQPVVSPKDMRRFIRFPLVLYRDDPLYVPHLLAERRTFFNPRKNPLFEFTDVRYFLALDGRGRVLGRVSAHVNRRHNEFWNERTGFFGFFECVQDMEPAAGLMQAAEAWLLAQGMDRARGPFNFSTNEECGFLAEGFDRPPAIMMPYTPPYYLDMMERLGYGRLKDLLALEYSYPGQIPERLARMSRRVQEHARVTVRCMDMRRFEEEVRKAFHVYNSAWQRNWGFVPMTEAEFRYMARCLKPVIDPAVALMVEKDGRIVAFSLALPDWNVLLRKMHGRLLPFGWIHALAGRRRISNVRVLTLGVIQEYRRSGIDALLYYKTFENGLPHGYRSCEMGWMLEDNEMIIRPMERMGAAVTKRYRIFEKAL